MQHNARYTVLFAAVVCVVCAIFVSSAAVSLAERQAENARLDKRRNVLIVAGLARPGERLSREQINERFQAVKPVAVDLETGEVTEAVDPATYDQQAAKNNPEMSRPAPPNDSVIRRLPDYAVVYEVLNENGGLRLLVLPVEGYGLWSTLYGFLALDGDLNTIRGLAFYQHGETPGLGGEVDNPAWRALWDGRRVYNEQGAVAISVIKGQAGPPERDPYQVDGLSGATITSRGVDHMIDFWLGENGFGPFLKRLRQQKSVS